MRRKVGNRPGDGLGPLVLAVPGEYCCNVGEGISPVPGVGEGAGDGLGPLVLAVPG